MFAVETGSGFDGWILRLLYVWFLSVVGERGWILLGWVAVWANMVVNLVGFVVGFD
jgi:hypothetical protein